MRAQIVHVRETWPLQLTILGSDGKRDVHLSDTTRITRAGQAATAGELRPGMQVDLEVSAGAHQAVSSIAIVE